ncbi:MAG: PilZ domain-containing protein, partial [Candidatus Omnitrophota bacterium]
TKDIGAGGVRVIIEESLDIHSMVGLEIYFRDEAILCEGRVVWVVSQDNSEARKKGLFDTGIEFFKIKEEDRCIINNMVESICLKKK